MENGDIYRPESNYSALNRMPGGREWFVSEQWYFAKDGKQEGPIAAAELKQLASSGRLSPTDLVRKDGMTVWAQASKVKGLFPAPVPPTPRPTASTPASSPSAPERKDGAIHTMKGVSEELAVFEDKVTITPKGAMGFLVKGLKGTKTIPFYSISAIQFKEAGAVFSGYIQFSIPGGNESKGGVFAAASDENTFMFAGRENNAAALKIKEFIETGIRKLRGPQTNSDTTSLSDELQKLARLREQGILSDDEFQSAKRRLIG